MTTTRKQVCRILNEKLRRIASREFCKANPIPPKAGKLLKAYSIPEEGVRLVAMLGRIETADSTELEEMASEATTGAIAWAARAT